MIGCWSKWWRGSACLYGASCPNQPLQLTPAAILVSRDSTVLQRPPQLNFAFGASRWMRPIVAGDGCGGITWRVGHRAEQAVAVDAGRHTGFARFNGSPAAVATELCVRRFEMDATDRR